MKRGSAERTLDAKRLAKEICLPEEDRKVYHLSCVEWGPLPQGFPTGVMENLWAGRDSHGSDGAVLWV